MYLNHTDFKTGWHGVSIGLRPDEIDQLIEMLRHLQANPESHFHCVSNFEGEGGIGDIEIYVQTGGQENNAQLMF